ncbi:MAG: type II toxin-antitoxin system VapC family toxin [Rhodocyclaceae bacterium]|nr:type II toxin-antitoxin system VapC family toxin [Rhodocyclaceae bacterium]
MILVDTSVWVDHLRAGDAGLTALLEEASVLTHPFVIGEIALGQLRQRQLILECLEELPRAPLASHVEVMTFIEQQGLPGRGIGYVDAHLLAAVCLAPGSSLWTRDKRLLAAATRLGLAATSAT